MFLWFCDCLSALEIIEEEDCAAYDADGGYDGCVATAPVEFPKETRDIISIIGLSEKKWEGRRTS